MSAGGGRVAGIGFVPTRHEPRTPLQDSMPPPNHRSPVSWNAWRRNDRGQASRIQPRGNRRRGSRGGGMANPTYLGSPSAAPDSRRRNVGDFARPAGRGLGGGERKKTERIGAGGSVAGDAARRCARTCRFGERDRRPWSSPHGESALPFPSSLYSFAARPVGCSRRRDMAREAAGCGQGQSRRAGMNKSRSQTRARTGGGHATASVARVKSAAVPKVETPDPRRRGRAGVSTQPVGTTRRYAEKRRHTGGPDAKGASRSRFAQRRHRGRAARGSGRSSSDAGACTRRSGTVQRDVRFFFSPAGGWRRIGPNHGAAAPIFRPHGGSP